MAQTRQYWVHSSLRMSFYFFIGFAKHKATLVSKFSGIWMRPGSSRKRSLEYDFYCCPHCYFGAVVSDGVVCQVLLRRLMNVLRYCLIWSLCRPPDLRYTYPKNKLFGPAPYYNLGCLTRGLVAMAVAFGFFFKALDDASDPYRFCMSIL